MTKPWEEQWRVGRKVGRTLYRHTDEDYDGEIIGLLDTREAAKLAAAAPKMARVLIEIEWKKFDGVNREMLCPFCYGKERNGHRQMCELADVLQEVGVR